MYERAEGTPGPKPSQTNRWPERALLWCLRLVILIIFLATVLGLRAHRWGVVGFVAWIASYAIVFAIWCADLLYLSRQALDGRAATFGFTAFFLLLYLSACFDPANGHFETIQQIDCGLHEIRTFLDSGFNSLCFIGYPTRQYYLSALPSLLFGPSITTMNLGGYLYFALGIVVFAAGLFRYLGGSARADLITALVLTVPPHWYWLNHSLVTFEQAGYPFCLGLLLVGALLRWKHTSSIVDAHVVMLSLLYLAFSYTPSVALFLSAIPVVGFMARRTAYWNSLILTLGLVVASFVASLSYRSLHIFDAEEGLPLDLAFGTLELLARQIVYQDVALPNWSPQFHAVFLGIMAVCMVGVLGWREMAMAWWVAGGIVACVFSKGYIAWTFEQQFLTLRGLFRIGVTLPVFSLLLARVASKMTAGIRRYHMVLSAVILLSLAFGMRFRADTREKRIPDPRFLLAQDLAHTIGERKSVKLWFDPAIPNGWDWIVVWRYFIPGFVEQSPMESCGSLSSAPEDTALVFLASESSCEREAKASGLLRHFSRIARSRLDTTDAEIWCRGCESPERSRS